MGLMKVTTMNALALIVAAFALTQVPAPTKAEQLQDAARKGDAATVTQLLDEGVDVNTKFRYSATALFYACDAGNVDVVKVLLNHGADMNLKDTFYGFTPLMLAANPPRKKKPEHTAIAKLLIAKGALGKDAVLASAAEDNDIELAKAILDGGGVPAAKLSDALEAAMKAQKPEMVALLQKAGAKPPEEFKIDPALLAKYAGVYKGPQGEIEIAVAGAGLTIGQPGAPIGQRGTMVPKDNTTFRGVGMSGTAFAFQVTGDKVTGFQIVPPQGSPISYTRVEK